jgi:hypothetical protein
LDKKRQSTACGRKMPSGSLDDSASGRESAAMPPHAPDDFETAYKRVRHPSSGITTKTLLARAESDTASALDALEATALLRRYLDDLEGVLVLEARDDGASWFDIGRALGCTKQAVWERYKDAEQSDDD